MIIRKEQLTDQSENPIPGKHYRIPMGKLPATFLDWLRGQPWLEKKYPTVAEYITRNKKVIDYELKKLEEEEQEEDSENYDVPF